MAATAAARRIASSLAAASGSAFAASPPACAALSAASASFSAASACARAASAAAAALDAAPGRPMDSYTGSPSSSNFSSSLSSSFSRRWSSSSTSSPAARAALRFARRSASRSSRLNANPDPPNPPALGAPFFPAFFRAATTSSAIRLRSAGTGCFASVIALTRSGANFASSLEMNVTAVPLFPARPVRPTLCT